MNTRNRFKSYPKAVKSCLRKDDELPVYGNLVVTPSQIEKMSDKGVPITSQNLQYSPEQGEQNPSWTIDPQRIRGVDPATLWENSEMSKHRARKALKDDIRRFGNDLDD